MDKNTSNLAIGVGRENLEYASSIRYLTKKVNYMCLCRPSRPHRRASKLASQTAEAPPAAAIALVGRIQFTAEVVQIERIARRHCATGPVVAAPGKIAERSTVHVAKTTEVIR